MRQNFIYVITAIQFGYKYANEHRSKDGAYHSYYKRTSKSQLKVFKILKSSTCGWFTNLKTAKKFVLNNWNDIHEQNNNAVVIEKVPEGITLPIREWWYEWDGKKYIPAKKPKEYEGVICFWS